MARSMARARALVMGAPQRSRRIGDIRPAHARGASVQPPAPRRPSPRPLRRARDPGAHGAHPMNIAPFLRLSERATLAPHDGGLSIAIPHIGRLIVPGIPADHPPIEIETRPLLHALGPRGQVGAVSALDVGPKRRAVAIGGDGWSMTLAGSDLRAAHHHALDPVPPPHVTLDATTLRRAVASLAPLTSTYSTALAGIELRQNAACIEFAASNGKQRRRTVGRMVSGRRPDHPNRAS